MVFLRSEDLKKKEKGFCGSFMKMVEEVKAMAGGDSSEQQRLLTEMVVADLHKKPQPLFPLGFPKKKRSAISTSTSITSGNDSSSCSVCPNSHVLDCQILQGISGESDHQVVLAAMVLADLKNKKPEEPAFLIGFPKKKRSLRVQRQNKPKIFIKFKRSDAGNGTASYSVSVSFASTCNNVGVKPSPIVDDNQKEGLVKLSNKRGFSEFQEIDGFKERNPKRLRNCRSQFLLHNTNGALCV